MLQICYKKPRLVIIYKKRKKDYERKKKKILTNFGIILMLKFS